MTTPTITDEVTALEYAIEQAREQDTTEAAEMRAALAELRQANLAAVLALHP